MSNAISFFTDQIQNATPLTQRNIAEYVSNYKSSGIDASKFEDPSFVGDKIVFALLERDDGQVEVSNFRASQLDGKSLTDLFGVDASLVEMRAGSIPLFRAV